MITNKADVGLALAVWLLADDYDYVEGVENYISTTTIMKPLRQIILPKRIPKEIVEVDVSDFTATSMGKALHDSVEKSWTNPKSLARSLSLLGYPQDMIDRVRVNPTDYEIYAAKLDGVEIIPIFLEQRIFRTFKGWTIGGKPDFIGEGIIQDQKSTSAYSWLLGSKDEDYQLQMSLYRWIDAAQPLPKIHEDYGRINFIFTDWQKAQARQNPSYPQARIQYRDINLLPFEEVESWVSHKLNLMEKYQNSPQDNLPECTDEELWRSDPVFKYYSDPTKVSGRSTRNFTDLNDARAFQASKGGKGILKTVPGEPKRCAYCPAFPICTQKDRYFDQ